MSTIGGSADKFSLLAAESKPSSPSSLDERISFIFNTALKSHESPPKEDHKVSYTVLSGTEELTTTIRGVAAGAGAVPADAPFTHISDLGPVFTSSGRFGITKYEVSYVRGKDLGDTVSSDVRMLALKDLPLPLPFDNKGFEEAKKRMGAVLVDPLEKRVFQKVTDALLHITFDDLLRSLEALIPRFNKALEGIPFTAITIEKKSNEWVTQIALHKGLKPPGALCVLENTNTCEKPARHDTIVIIDDGSYSGEQVCSIITTIFSSSKHAGTNIKKFFIVVPFLTTEAINAILAKEAEHDVDVEIMSVVRMPTIPEILTEEEARCFQRMCFDVLTGPTLAFTDWRKPDILSAPTDFLEGLMMYTSPEGRPRNYMGPPLVPSIIGPYKLKRD